MGLGAARQGVQEILSLFQHAQGDPQGFLDPLGLTGEQRQRGEGMSGVTAVTQAGPGIDLPELWSVGWRGRVAIWRASLAMIRDHQHDPPVALREVAEPELSAD